jgi:hypothetical protein
MDVIQDGVEEISEYQMSVLSRADASRGDQLCILAPWQT